MIQGLSTVHRFVKLNVAKLLNFLNRKVISFAARHVKVCVSTFENYHCPR